MAAPKRQRQFVPLRISIGLLVLGIGITESQYYWMFNIGWLAWYHSNPTPFPVTPGYDKGEPVGVGSASAGFSRLDALPVIQPTVSIVQALKENLLTCY